jgi:hypothetical protein
MGDRFISAEPLLGPVDLMKALGCDACGHPWRFHTSGGMCQGTEKGIECYCVLPRERSGLDLVIAGNESNGRPGRAEWIAALQAQCHAAGVAFFGKQYGSDCRVGYYDRTWRDFYEANGWDWPDPIGWDVEREGQPPTDSVVRLRFKDRKGGDPSEWPADLRVRSFPEVRQ